MSGTLQNVVVIGASGNLGPSIVKELVAANLKVTATTREGSTSTFPEGITVAKTDYSEESLAQIFSGKDAVISLLGGENVQLQTTFIDAAVKAGVKRFFPSEFGSDTTDPASLEELPLFKVKKGIVDYLKSKEKDGLSWTAVVSGLFFDWGLKVGFFEFDLKKKTAIIWDSGISKVSTTNTFTIGKAIASILSKPAVAEATANKYIAISSHTVSQNEILAALEEITGEKWTVTKKNSAEEAKKAKEQIAAGNHWAVYDLIKAHAFGDDAHADATHLYGGLWDERLGLPKEDLKEDLKNALASI